MYIFLDLETTGLDPKSDLIIEAGFIITDDEFDVIDSRDYVFPMSNWIQNKLDTAELIVVEMHTANHLIADMAKLQAEGNNMSYTFYKNALEADVLNWFAMCGLTENTISMTGETIHFDRAFLKELLPNLEAWFHYRNFDVSTLKQASKAWTPEWYNKQAAFNEPTEHRALPDCEQALGYVKLIRTIFSNLGVVWPILE